jgi:HK97 family phage portal protein
MLDNLRARAALALLPKKARDFSPFQVISTHPANIPIYTEVTIRKATREGYKISVFVYRAIRTIIQAASGIPWVALDDKGEPIEGHPFAKVWAKPNPQFSGQDNMEFIIAHQLLCGNALLQPIIVGGKPKEFWMVMPDLVQPIPSDVPGEWLKGWRVTTAGGNQHDVPPDQFLHFMQVDPGNPYWGMGPLMSAARTIDTDNEAQDTQKISMQNRATPDGVFTHESVLTPEQFEEARRQIRENFLAKSKKREPWVLGAGAKWNQMSMTPVEMDFIASRLANLRGIAAAFGLDPWWLGDRSASTYNNIIEARKALYIEVVLPMLDDIKSTLNLRIAPMYGNITISYDTSKVAALRADYSAKVEQAKTLWAMGIPFDQINERLEMGFEEFPGWDRGYLPMTLLPTSAPAEDEDSEKTRIAKSNAVGMGLVEGESTKTLNLSTEEQKTAHWKRVDRRRTGWWEVVNRKVLPLYEAEAKAVAKALKGKTPAMLVEAVAFAIDDGKHKWEKTLTAISAALIEDFGGEIADGLGAEKSAGPAELKWEFDPLSPAIRAWISQHGAENVKTILATNLEEVKRIILMGIDENLSTVQIGRDLKQFYTDRSAYKAMRIARTETSRAAGFGQREAAKQSGVVKTHTWVTSRDDRVRDEHVAVDGETKNLNESYSTGEMYPGENSINCRCVESYGTGR